MLIWGGDLVAQNGTWTNLTSGGSWSGATNWSGGAVANGAGFTARFDTLNPTGDITVRLDSPRSIGSLAFADATVSSAASWILDNNGNAANVLTLDAAAPSISVGALGTSKVTLISAVLAGSAGFTKSGAGTLVLTAANTVSGPVNLAGGGLQLRNVNALAGATSFAFSSGTTLTLRADASSTFPLPVLSLPASGSVNLDVNILGSGSAQTHAVGGGVKLDGASTTTTTVNVTASNSCKLTIPVVDITNNGAATSQTRLVFNPTTAALTLGNVNGYTTGGGRDPYLILDGTNPAAVVSGRISNPPNGAAWTYVVKQGSGKWTLTGAGSNYAGNTNVNAGILNIQGNSALGSSNRGTSVASGATLQIESVFDLNYTTAETVTLNGAGVGGAGALQNVGGNNTFAGLIAFAGPARINSDAGFLNLSATGVITGPTFDLTVGGAGDVRIAGVIGTTSGGVNKDGSGTLTLAGVNTYTGATSVSAGTLALAATGGLSADSELVLAPGATLDVSALSAFSLGANAAFSATGSTTSAATLRAGASATFGTRPVSLTFSPAAFTGDDARPALRVASGSLSINGPLGIVNGAATPLGSGVYLLVAAAGGTISGAPIFSGIVGGAGLAVNHTAFVRITGAGLELVVENPAATTTTVARAAGTPASAVYGTPLSFAVTVSPSSSTGVVELRAGGAGGLLLGTATLSAGSATVALARTALPAGAHPSIVAVYLGSLGHEPSVSAPLSPGQTVTAKPLTMSGLVVNNKFFDGTAAATLSAALAGVESGDDVTLLGTGVFASAAVGTGIAVTSTATLGGASAANYMLLQPTGLSASILGATVWSGAAGDTLWDTGANWTGASSPGGAGVAATFSALDLVADTTVNLASSRTIGHLVFGDTDRASPAGWVISDNGSATNVLTLSGSSPSVTVYPLGPGKGVTIGATIAGTAGLTKIGAGELVLAGLNTYSGGTNVNEGSLTISTGGALGAAGQIAVGQMAGRSVLNINGGAFALAGNQFLVGRGTVAGAAGVVNQSGGSVSFTAGNALFVGNNSATGVYNLSGGTLSGYSSSTRGVVLGASSGSSGTFNLSGNGTLSLGSGALLVGRSDTGVSGASVAFNQTGGNATIGTLVIGGGSSSSSLNASFSLTGGAFAATSFPTLAGAASSTVNLTLGGSAQVTLPAFPSRVGTVNLTLDFTTGFLTPSANSTSYLGGLSRALLTANGADFNVPGGRSITVAQSFADAPGHAGAFAKIGAGSLTLTSAQNYSGPTTVSGGSLLINGSGSLSAASVVMVASGGTLGGTGTIHGPVSVAAGGTLNPGGAAIGDLTLATAPALDGTLLINVDRAAIPNSGRLVVPGSLALGGVLRVANLGADLQAGDSFALLSAASYSGAFSSVLLPALGYGLAWNTSQLAVSGTVSVQVATGFATSTTTLAPLTTHQQIHGIGTNYAFGPQSIAWNTTRFNQAISPSGLNISFVRLANSFECWLDEPDIFWRGWDTDNARFIRMFRELQPEGLITISAWSPPGRLKSTGSAWEGTLAKNGSAYRYADYADWWLRSLQNLRDNNPTLPVEKAIPDFISIQNESDFTPGGETFYAAWQAGNYLNSVETSAKAGYPQALAAVNSAFDSNGFGFVKFIGPDTTTGSASVISAYLNNLPSGALAAIAHHPYQGSVNNVGNNTTAIAGLRAAYPDTTIYMTEFFGDDSYGPDVPAWMMHALPIHNVFTVESANAYLAWGVNTTDPTSETYCALGHFSKFIRPKDWRSAASTTDANVRVSLYRRPIAAGVPDQLTLVMINKGANYSYQTIQTSAHWPADPSRRAWKVFKTANDGSTQQRLSLVENLSGASLSGDRNLVLAPYSLTTIVLNTDTPPTAAELWRVQHFGDSAPIGAAADLADPDADGETNLYEFATGQNPKAGAIRAPIVSAAGGGATLELTYTRSVAAMNAGFVFSVEASDTLAGASWTSVGVAHAVLSDNGTLQTARGSVPLSGATKRFLRLRVTKP